MDSAALAAVTIVCPYYRQPLMLGRQLEEWAKFPKGYSFVVVDDGSPEPASAVVEKAPATLLKRLRLYRITVDIPWNRGGARNLGALEARTDWIVHVDTDHVMPAWPAAPALLEYRPKLGRWFRFRRWRQGRADFTRKKDGIAPEVPFGEIHPHIDSYLIERATYDRVGGYDEDFSGCLGGGTEFLARLEVSAGPPAILPLPITLHVYTTERIADASITTLSRDRAEGKERRRRKVARAGGPRDPIRFPWVRVL